MENRGRWVIPPITILFLIYPMLLPTNAFCEEELSEFSGSNWEKLSDDDAIITYRAENEKSHLFAFKAIGTIDAPIARIATILIDSAHDKDWAPDLVDARVIREISPMERVEYWGVKTSIFTKDRDFVLHVSAELDQTHKRLIFRFHSVEDPDAPLTSKVRGFVRAGAYILKPIDDGKTQVEFIVDLDPKGTVAKWIVNATQKNYPRDTFLSLRKQSTKSDIPDNPEVKTVLSPLLGSRSEPPRKGP